MNLLREYVHYSMLIEWMKSDLATIEESRMTAKSLVLRMGKSLGSVFHHRLKEIEAELRKQGVWVRYEDTGGESVYVTVKGKRHEFKRVEIEAELEGKLDEIAGMIENRPVEGEYQPKVPDKDPYAKE